MSMSNIFIEKILRLLFPIVDTAPVGPPTIFIGFALYRNGTTKRFYIYFLGEWSYVALT